MTDGAINTSVHAGNRAPTIDMLRKMGFHAAVAHAADTADSPAGIAVYHRDQTVTLIEVGDRLHITGGQIHITGRDGKTAVLSIPPAEHDAFDKLGLAVFDAADRLRNDLRNALGRFNDGAVWIPTESNWNISAWTAPFTDGTGNNEPPAPPAAPVSPVPPVMPDGIRIIEPPTVWSPLRGEQVIAVCGGIPGVKPWHDDTAELIADRYVETAAYRAGRRLAIVIPRRRDVRRDEDGAVWFGDEPWSPSLQDEQVAWEWDHVRKGVGLFWYPESDARFVMPTTMLELGLAWRRIPIAVGAHPGYARRDILEHATPRMGLELFDTLRGTVELAVRHLNTDIN